MRFQYLIQRQSECGIFVVLTALMIIVIIGIVGLAIDVSRQLVVNAELQNSADACALGGVLELNGATDAPKRAAQTGKFLGGLKNYDNFQKEPVSYGDPNITFSVNRDGPYVEAASAPSNAVYMKCVTPQRGLVNMFMGVLGFAKSDLSATAIATLQPAQSVCMVPMSIHAKDISDSTLFGYKEYDIINNQHATLDGANNGTPDAKVSGVFNFANPLGNSSANANEVGEWISGLGVCNVPTKNGTCIDEIPTNGVTKEWNSRFGVYSFPTNSAAAAAIPDQTGAAYDYQVVQGNNKAIVAYKTVDEPGKNPFVKVAGDGWTGGNYKLDPAAQKALHLQYGTTNRRLVGLPVVDPGIVCNGGGGHPIVGWACGLMLAPYDTSTNKQNYRVQRVQILGRADKTSYCGTMGIPGGNEATGPLVPALVQ